MPASLARPSANEYAPDYESYIRLINEPDVLAVLAEQLRETTASLRSFPESKAGVSNEPGKWSVKEIIGHIIDCERIFAYRALRFARNDPAPLPGFEQEPYMLAACFNERPLADLVNEYEHVRLATIDLFRSLSAEAGQRTGVADGKSISVRALASITAGHERHHMSILRRRYL